MLFDGIITWLSLKQSIKNNLELLWVGKSLSETLIKVEIFELYIK